MIMKTNQIMIRKIDNFTIQQRTKDGYFNATALIDAWNSVPGNEQKRLDKFWGSDNTKEFIKALVEEEVQRAMKEITAQIEQQGIPVKPDMIKHENYVEPSERRVKLGLIVRDVVESHKIEMDTDAIRERAAEMAGNYSEPSAFVDAVMADAGQRNQIGGILVEEQVVEILLKDADIKVDQQSYEDFMTATQPAQ